MSLGTLLIRADASVTAGTGHVMRCLALGQAWQDSGGQVVFASARITDALRQRLCDEAFDIEAISSLAGSSQDAEQTAAVAHRQKADWIVVDGYAFGPEYQQTLREAGSRVLFIDDYGHAPRYFSDVVLNQNVTAARELYSDREPDTRLLLGTKYCLLRREFARWREWQRKISPQCRRVLVIMGGSDPGNITKRVLEALAAKEFRELEITVVAGGSNPNFEGSGNLAASGNVVVKRDVKSMAELMAASDLAISAAGSTCWELCFMGLPALLVDVADNQTAVAMELNRRECAIHVGGPTVTPEMIAERVKQLMGSAERRQSLSVRSRQLVDGYGAARIASILRGEPTIQFRRVRAEDERLLWEWANDPEVRAASFSSAPILWETHTKWFGEKSIYDKSFFLIAEDSDGIAVGQIRFDLHESDADLNFSIAKEKRGLGLAVPLVEKAMRELWAHTACIRVHAFVKPENIPSARTFEKAGFSQSGVKQIGGNAALHFFRTRA